MVLAVIGIVQYLWLVAVVHPQGLLDVLRLCAVLVKKLLSWLLLVTCVCGVILHYLLLIIDWIVRETEEHQQLTGKDVKLETPEDTGQ